MKVLIACTLLIVSAIAEPPVDNRYLPPQQGSFGAPSQSYGAPGVGNFGRQTTAVFGARQSSYSSRSSSRRPSSQYIPPSTQYGAPVAQISAAPSSQYGAPSGRFGAPLSQYGAPSSQYGTPSSQYGAPAQARQPSSQYGVPSQGLARSRSFSSQASRAQSPSVEYGVPSAVSPSQLYGAPGLDGIGGSGSSGYSGAEQNRQYLPPGGGRGGYGGEDDGSSEPANYSFEYMVKDEPSGNDFGHREARQGDRAEGLYYVLLPDGRKQTVEYEADQRGYRPRISYEDLGVAGYGNQGYQGQDGYSNQGGPY